MSFKNVNLKWFINIGPLLHFPLHDSYPVSNNVFTSAYFSHLYFAISMLWSRWWNGDSRIRKIFIDNFLDSIIFLITDIGIPSFRQWCIVVITSSTWTVERATKCCSYTSKTLRIVETHKQNILTNYITNHDQY